MSNGSLVERTLIICQSYEAGEINLESLVSGVELNIGALEGMVESQRQHLGDLVTSLELAQLASDGEDRTRKVDSLVERLKDGLQSMMRANSAA